MWVRSPALGPAWARVLQRNVPTPDLEGFSARKLRNYYLLNPDEDGKKRYKLLLTQTDEQTLLAIIGQGKIPEANSLRVRDTFEFFEMKVRELGEDIAPALKASLGQCE